MKLAAYSYGPCQTPTLGFCVQRYLNINTFKPQKFWIVHPYIVHKGYELKLEWDREKLFDLDVSNFPAMFMLNWQVVKLTFSLSF